MQLSILLGTGAHLLDGIHDIGLLGEERVAEVGGPLNVAREQGKHIGERDEGLHAGIPVHLPGRIDKLCTAHALPLAHPVGRLLNLHRVRACGQHLAKQRIGIKRYRGHQVIQLLRRENRRLRRLLIIRLRILLRRILLRRSVGLLRSVLLLLRVPRRRRDVRLRGRIRILRRLLLLVIPLRKARRGKRDAGKNHDRCCLRGAPHGVTLRSLK